MKRHDLANGAGPSRPTTDGRAGLSPEAQNEALEAELGRQAAAHAFQMAELQEALRKKEQERASLRAELGGSVCTLSGSSEVVQPATVLLVGIASKLDTLLARWGVETAPPDPRPQP